MRRVELHRFRRGTLLKIQKGAWVRLAAGCPTTFNAQWASWEAEVTEF